MEYTRFNTAQRSGGYNGRNLCGSSLQEDARLMYNGTQIQLNQLVKALQTTDTPDVRHR